MYVSSTAVAVLLLYFLPSAGGTGDACNTDDLVRLQDCARRLVNALRFPLIRDVICTEEMTDDIECISSILDECQDRRDIANTHARISPLLERSQSKLDEICRHNGSSTTETYDTNASTPLVSSCVMATVLVLFGVISWRPWLLVT